jgi:hypothetical protein
MNGPVNMPTKVRRNVASPAPKAYKMLGSDRVVIEALCPEIAMTHFAFGNFCREEADDVRVVHCPICGRKHALMWPAAWVSGVAIETEH